MDSMIVNFFVNQWQKKCAALFAAVVIWLLVNNSITSTKTIPYVPVRVVNIPTGKTVQGLLPNGILSKRVALTLSGTKDVINQIEPGDIEVHIDAANNPDEWIIQINKKNLVSLNPTIALSHHITHVTHNEFVIKMSRLTTGQVPITLLPPTGEAPKGYQFLDIWPQMLTHTISGPEEQVKALCSKGMEISFNLSEITKGDLDALQSAQQANHNDEVHYEVPGKWKEITIPFLNQMTEEINDVDAHRLHINFLRQKQIPLQSEIPIRLFYPAHSLSVLNPETVTLANDEVIQKRKGVHFLTVPLYAFDVSELFLDIIRNHIEISVTLSLPFKEQLPYSIEFINARELENHYVAAMMTTKTAHAKALNGSPQEKEKQLRMRFRDYMEKFVLYTQTQHKLQLIGLLDRGNIKISIDTLAEKEL